MLTAPLRLFPPHALSVLGFRPLRAEPQRALQDPCSSCYDQCANLPSAMMPTCYENCDRGPCGAGGGTGGGQTGGQTGGGTDEEEGPPEW